MSAETEPQRFSTIEALFATEWDIDSWQMMVLRVGQIVHDTPTGLLAAAKATFSEKMSTLREDCGHMVNNVDDAATEWAQRSFEEGVLLGFGLARAWPQRPEDFDGWLEAARRVVCWEPP